jgi:formamidopyrimidine-DNA glycosylase
MPELPDIHDYIEALKTRVTGQPLEKARVASPFLLRTYDPPLFEVEGKRVLALRRLGKRIVFCLEDDLFLVLHLMIAGRLRWKERGAKIVAKIGLAAFDFPTGTLLLTEASSKKRASLFLLRGEDALRAHDPGGLDLFALDLSAFKAALLQQNRTLKRALTDPTLFSGIGNAYSDEILHRAKLSPVKWTSRLTDSEVEGLFTAARNLLSEWMERLRRQTGDGFPENVTAFRPDMAVHGKYGSPCPVCGTPVQRIRYAENEANYCPTCQTGGKLLADRSLSRLLKEDWPKTLEELEERKAAARAPLTPTAPTAPTVPTASAVPTDAGKKPAKPKRSKRL